VDAVQDRSISASPATVAATLAGTVGPLGGGAQSVTAWLVVGPASTLPVVVRTATLSFHWSVDLHAGIVFVSVAPLAAFENGLPVPVVP
jgi:hypothetical protein